MKQYDSIFVKRFEPNNDEYLEIEGCGLDQVKGPVIVLTIEEAEKIWDAGWRAKALENNSEAKWTDFKSWMEYKGVKI